MGGWGKVGWGGGVKGRVWVWVVGMGWGHGCLMNWRRVWIGGSGDYSIGSV